MPDRCAPARGLPAPAEPPARGRHDQRAARPADGEVPPVGGARRHARRRPDAGVGSHPRAARRRRRHRAGGPGRLRADGGRAGARHPRRRQQPRQHPARGRGWCRPSGCCSTSRSMPSTTASATASSTCSPRTARSSPPPARAASCGSGASRPKEAPPHDRRPTRHDLAAPRPPRTAPARPASSSWPTSATPTCGRPRPTAPTPSRRWPSPRRGSRGCGSARPSCRPSRGPRPAWRSPWPRWPTPRPAASRSASASSSNVIVERWNGVPVRRAVQAGPRHGAVPQGGAQWREGRPRATTRFEVQGFRLGVRPEVTPNDPGRRPAARDAAPGRPRGATAPSSTGSRPRTWPRWRRSSTPQGPDKEIVCRIFVCPSEDAEAVRTRRASSPSPPTSTCRSTPRSTSGWAGATQLQGMWDAWKAGDRKAALAAIPDDLVDELIVHGSPEQCRATHPALLRQRRDHVVVGAHAARPRSTTGRRCGPWRRAAPEPERRHAAAGWAGGWRRCASWSASRAARRRACSARSARAWATPASPTRRVRASSRRAAGTGVVEEPELLAGGGGGLGHVGHHGEGVSQSRPAWSSASSAALSGQVRVPSSPPLGTSSSPWVSR